MYLLNIFNMPKILTIKDTVYERLKKIKIKLGLSFSETIDYLLNIYDSHGSKSKILNLKSSINDTSLFPNRYDKLLR